MNNQEYQKVFDHFTDLSQRYAMGKIQHDALREGLKKLITEYVTSESQKLKGSAFGQGLVIGVLLTALLGAAAFFLWSHGFLSHWIK